MAKVITRFFDDMDALHSARTELVTKKKLPSHIVKTYGDADGLVAALTSKGVDQGTAEAYHARMGKGGAVLMVLADYTPLGVARITRETLAGAGAAELGGLPEEAVIKFVSG